MKKICRSCGETEVEGLVMQGNVWNSSKNYTCIKCLRNPDLWNTARRLIPTDFLIRKMSRKRYRSLNNFEQQMLNNT